MTFPDVYSYDEDDMVLDPKLPEHLSHFGIDMMTMEKVGLSKSIKIQGLDGQALPAAVLWFKDSSSLVTDIFLHE